MAATAPAVESKKNGATPVLLGGFAALAESAWMGIAQATEILEPLRLAVPRLRGAMSLSGLLTREITIAEATIVLMASFFFSALLGAVRQVLFNAQFGTGPDANAYYAAFRLPDTLFSLIAGGALSSAMIPVLLSTTRDEGEAAGKELVNRVLTLLLVVLAAIVLIGELLTPAFVTDLLAPGFDAETNQLATTLTRIMLVQPIILAIGSVATAVLNSRNRFILVALSVASHNISLILGILAARVFPGLGIYGPTLGVVGGAVLQTLILAPGLVQQGFHIRPAWNLADPQLREIVRLLIPNGLAVGVGYVGFILDTSFASRAAESASLPAINNAFLLVGLPVALLGQAIGQSAFPRIAAHAAAMHWQRMRRTVFGTLGVAVALALPALLGLVLIGRPIIRLLFEHGRFDAAAGSLTYNVLVVYALALPALVGTEVVARGLIALRDTRTPLVTNTVQILGRALMMAIVIGSLGVVAIPLALAVMASLEVLVLLGVLVFKLRHHLRSEAASRSSLRLGRV